MANKLAAGLAQVSQGLSQVGNAFEFQMQVEQRKKEMEFREKEFAINKKKFEIAEKEIAMNEFGSLQKEYITLENENKTSANDWLKMKETQDRINELAPKMGMSTERAYVSLKNESDFFRNRRAAAQSSLTSYASTIRSDAPEMAAQLEVLAGNVAKSRSKEDLETLMKDSRDFLGSAFQFQKQKDTDPSAISVNQFYESFKPVPADTPGAQKVTLKGGEVKYGVVKPKDVVITTNQSEDVRKSIASQFGIGEQLYKVITPNMERGKILPDVDEVTSQAEQLMKQGLTPQKAIQGAMGQYKEQVKTVDSQLQKLIDQGGEEGKAFIKQKFGTLKIDRIPLTQKLKVLQEISGGGE